MGIDDLFWVILTPLKLKIEAYITQSFPQDENELLFKLRVD